MDRNLQSSGNTLPSDHSGDFHVIVPVEEKHPGRVDMQELLKVINQEAQNSEVVSPSIVLASSSSSSSSSSESHGGGLDSD